VSTRKSHHTRNKVAQKKKKKTTTPTTPIHTRLEQWNHRTTEPLEKGTDPPEKADSPRPLDQTNLPRIIRNDRRRLEPTGSVDHQNSLPRNPDSADSHQTRDGRELQEQRTTGRATPPLNAAPATADDVNLHRLHRRHH